MPDPDLLTLFVRPLEDVGIRYMVSGSVAATLFGRQYQENQDYQRALLPGQDREGTGMPSMPADADCVETSTGANSGGGTVTRNRRSRSSTP